MRLNGSKIFRRVRLARLDNLADLAGLGAAVILGGVMIVGLLTASGRVSW